MSNILKTLIMAVLLMPGIALADNELSVEPPRQEAVLAPAPEVSPDVKVDLTTILPLVLLEKKQELPKPVVPKPTPPPTPIIHEVQEGDTLTAVAEQHEMTWTRVYDANTDVVDPNLIQPGQKLKIPRPEEQIPVRPIPENAPPVVEPASQATYTQVTHTTSELIGRYGYALAGGNCVNTARAYGKNQPGNPISWVATTQTPYIGAAALFNFNHVAVVVGIHSNGDLEVAHENCPGCPSRYPRSAFRGFF